MREKRCLLENPHAWRGMNLFRTIVKSRQAKAKMHAHGSVDNLVDGLSRFKLGLLNGPLESEDGTDSVLPTIQKIPMRTTSMKKSHLTPMNLLSLQAS